jgi:hypothetical protein
MASGIQRELQAVPDGMQENYFHGAFVACKERWDHCISSQGD